ncbi:MAG: class I SAM-dependent methyltransferase [Actinomycetota bacterium]|nr:class I SAM-dependent methyltransferase [Actinomycetota bacterium]
MAERRRWNDDYWASVWPRREVLTSAVTNILLSHLALDGRERVLDIGSGGGTITIAAGQLVGARGSAVGADISAPLVAVARRRADDAQAGNVWFCVADVQHDTLVGAPFDVAVSQFGVMFFDEPAKAFANIRRHLVSGGRLAFACWQAIEQNPWFVGPALASFVAAPPPPAPGQNPTGPFSLSDPKRVREILAAAGWKTPTRTAYETVARVDSDALVDDGQLTFLGVPEESFDDAQRAVDEQLDPLRDRDVKINAHLAIQIFTATA